MNTCICTYVKHDILNLLRDYNLVLKGERLICFGFDINELSSNLAN